MSPKAIIRQSVDTEWLEARITRVGLMKRQVAEAMGKDPAQLTRLLKGEYAWEVRDLASFCKAVNAPFVETARHLGVDVEATSESMAVKGTIDREGIFHAAGQFEPNAPAIEGAGEEAIRIKDAGPLKSVVLYVSSKAVPAEQCAGCMAVVKVRGKDILRFIVSGAKAGFVTLIDPTGAAPREDDVKAGEALPVRWIRM